MLQLSASRNLQRRASGCLFQAESRRSESRVNVRLYTGSLALAERMPKLRSLVTVVQTNG